MIDAPLTGSVSTQGGLPARDDLMADLQAYERVAFMNALASRNVLGAIAQGHNTAEALARVGQLRAPSLQRPLRAALDMGLLPPMLTVAIASPSWARDLTLINPTPFTAPSC